MIQTVLGNIRKEDITMVLPHEHILSDLRPLVSPIDNGIFYDEVKLENHGELTRNPYAVLDNAFLEKEEIAIKEIALLNKCGCNLVADVTTSDFGRNPIALREISKKTGINIVVGCGCYVDCAVAEQIKTLSVPQLKKIIVDDLTVGIDGTDIKSGVIGEIGSGMEITDCEYNFLKAAAEAQAETGFGMHIHACLWNDEGLNALKYAVKCGANAQKLCVDHADVRLNKDYILGVLNEGAYIEFDDFGKEYYVDRRNRNLLLESFASDFERAKFIKQLVDMGYLNQMLEDVGLSQKEIYTIMRDNPIRFLEHE